MCADVVHEVVGHGGTCLILGQNIKLVTSVYFTSTPGNLMTDLGGPISNLFFGVLIFAVLTQRKDLSAVSWLLFFLTMSYNLFWFSGTILQSSFSKTGDWTYAITDLNIGMYEKPILIVAGITAYYFSIKLIGIHLKGSNSNRPTFPLRQSICCSYCAAGIAAVVAGLFFQPGRVHAAFEGLLEMIGSLPIVFIGFRQKAHSEVYDTKSGVALNVIISILFGVFCFTLGRGFIL